MTDAITPGGAAELAIRNLISRIAILADQGDLDVYADQFTEDAVRDLPAAPRQGRADIRAGAELRRAEGVTGPTPPPVMSSRTLRSLWTARTRRRPIPTSYSCTTPRPLPPSSIWASTTTVLYENKVPGAWPDARSPSDRSSARGSLRSGPHRPG